MKKRILSILLVVMMLVTMMPMTAFAEETEMSDEFKAILNENGELVLNAYPDEENMFFLLSEFIWISYNEYGEFSGDPSTYNPDTSTMDVSLLTSDNWETHNVEIVFSYDESILELATVVADSFPADKDYFIVKDMELVNYWANHVASDDEEDTTNGLDNYSSELKQYTDSKNFDLYVQNGLGYDEDFLTFRRGMAMLRHEGVTYFSDTDLGTKAEHIIYVPDETGDSKEELMVAVQNRIDNYLGVGKATITYGGNDLMEMYQVDLDGYDELIQSAEDEEVASWIEEEKALYIEEHSFYLNAEGGYWFNIAINGTTYKFVVIKDSDSMMIPTYKSSDLITNVTVSSTDSTVPLDAIISVDKLTSGTEYDKIIQLLNVETNQTFDISLYSETLKDNVTKLDNGTFEVKIPLTEELKGKDLLAYYVDGNNNIVKYDVTVKDGYAVFETNHFSIYTLAEGSNTGGAGGAVQQPEVIAPSTNVASGKLSGDADKIVEKIPFTDAEKALIDSGAKVEITLEVKDATSTVSNTDKNLINSKLGDHKVGLYLDINLFKQVGDENAVKVPELNDKVTISLKVPDNLIETEADINREYSIIRIHDEEATVLEPKFDESTKYLTFETDHFSTYALVYKDVAVVPSTGDMTSIVPWMCIMIAGVGIILTNKNKKKEF